jgi:small subunit ribosomal protein S11
MKNQLRLRLNKMVEEENKTKDVKVEEVIEEDKKDDEKSSEKKVEEKKAPKRRDDRIGVLNIYTTFNNTVMNLTDMSGKSLAKFSGGQSTKQDRLKANPTIAMFIAQRVAEEARDNGITGFYVKIRASTGQNNPGPGAHAAIKSLTRAGFKILSIMDTTRIARGGPKKKGGRRGRRV